MKVLIELDHGMLIDGALDNTESDAQYAKCASMLVLAVYAHLAVQETGNWEERYLNRFKHASEHLQSAIKMLDSVHKEVEVQDEGGDCEEEY